MVFRGVIIRCIGVLTAVERENQCDFCTDYLAVDFRTVAERDAGVVFVHDFLDHRQA